MIDRNSSSYPLFAIAQHHDVPYNDVLDYADFLQWGYGFRNVEQVNRSCLRRDDYHRLSYETRMAVEAYVTRPGLR